MTPATAIMIAMIQETCTLSPRMYCGARSGSMIARTTP